MYLRLFKKRYMVYPDCRGRVVDTMIRGGSEQCLCLTELLQAGVKYLEFFLTDL